MNSPAATALKFYSAFGIGIHSEFDFPDFLQADSSPDVIVRVARGPFAHPKVENQSYFFDIQPDRALLFFDEVATFQIENGNSIIIHPVPGVEDSKIRLFMMGTVMGMLLTQRGYLVLHASAVRILGRAVAFLGESGYGKSSIAGALHARGHAVVSDDLSPVDLSGSPTIIPGFPRIKLVPEIALSLGYKRESLSELHHGEHKMGRSVKEGFETGPLPLRAVFVLDKQASTPVEAIRPQEAVIELVRHSYPTRLFKGGGPPHLMKCAKLVGAVSVFRLRSFTSLADIPEIAKTVEVQAGQ